ncbi:MAG TPA: DUF4388 domain-containing protein [Ktedonobacteraceae bacterium]|nr:DUF4388 domain-containing protein [Ktedonobacteraceae bacterium]
MSPIGSLEKVSLPEVLRRVESYGKTGLLKVQQGQQAVELYFRRGQLMCIGPVQAKVTLGERLLQDNIISPEALQEVMSAIELSHPSETRIALTLIDLGHVNHEILHTWAANEAAKVIRILLTWSAGEIYFEDEVQPAPERLLISLSVSSLLPAPVAQPAGAGAIPTSGQVVGAAPTSTHISPAPTIFEASQFFTGSDVTSMVPSASSWLDVPISERDRNTERLTPSKGSLTPPRRVNAPVPQGYFNTAFMQAQMVLVPTDLAGQRERNPQVALTPDQWRIFTRADGQTSLQTICMLFSMTRDQVCQIVAQLLALGLVTLAVPTSGPLNELSPISRDFINAGLSNGYVAPGYAAALPSPWAAAIMPATENASQLPPPAPIETESQWGNGGNGATFHIGNGWVVASLPSQSLQTSGPLPLSQRVYAQAGNPR